MPTLLLRTGYIGVATGNRRCPDRTLVLSTFWDSDLAWLICWVLQGLRLIICTVSQGSAEFTAQTSPVFPQWEWCGAWLALGTTAVSGPLFPGRPGSLMVSEEGYSKLNEDVAILVPGTPPFSEGGLWAWSPPHILKSQRNRMP